MDHINEEKLNSFLSGEMPVEEHERVERHLAGCPDCRRELTEMYRTSVEEIYAAPKELKEKAKSLPPSPEREARSFFSFLLTPRTALALAGLLVVFSLVGLWAWRAPDDSVQTPAGDVFRRGENTGNAPQLKAPADNAELTGSELNFTWSGVPEAVSYTLIISDETGDIVFQRQIRTENLTVPAAEADLTTGKYYFWHIRARTIDGKALETEPRKFFFR